LNIDDSCDLSATQELVNTTSLDDTIEATADELKAALGDSSSDEEDDFPEIEFKTVTINQIIDVPVPTDAPVPTEEAAPVVHDEAAAPLDLLTGSPSPAPTPKSPCMTAAVSARRVTRSVTRTGALKSFARVSMSERQEQEEREDEEEKKVEEEEPVEEPTEEPVEEPTEEPVPIPASKPAFASTFSRVSMAVQQSQEESEDDDEPEPTPKKTFTFSRVVVQPTPTPKKRVKKVKKSTPKAATPPKRKPLTMKAANVEADDKAKIAQAKAKARLKARAMAEKKKKASGNDNKTVAKALNKRNTRGRSTTRKSATSAVAAKSDAPPPPPSASASRLYAPTTSSSYSTRAKSTPAPPPAPTPNKAAHAPRSLTVAKSPQFRTRARSMYSKPNTESTADIEYKKMIQERADLKKKMKMRNKYKDKAAYGIMGITQQKARELQAQQNKLTVPTSPDLPTSRKYGHKNYGAMGTHTTMNMVNPNPISTATNSPTHNIITAPSPASSVSSHRTLETTVPEPFSFSSSTKRRPSVPSTPRTPPINETVHNFFQSLHSVSKGSAAKAKTVRHGALTDAKSPQFVTKARASTRALPKSTAELEEELMERFRKNPFRARAINQKVMASQGDIGVPKTRPRGLTEPRGFSFRSDARAANPTPTRKAARRATSRNDDHSDLNSSVCSNSSRRSTSSSVCRGLTTPVSPNLSTSRRRRTTTVSQTPTFSSTKKTLDLSSAKKDGKTIPVPFNLRTDVRGSATKAKIEDIKKREEEEAERLASSFKAKPIITEDAYSCTATPSRTPAKLTSPKPFNLISEQLHEVAQAELHEKIERENAELELQMSAKKANPVPATTYRPNFTPKPSDRAPLSAISPELNTRSQAKNRAEFDKVNKERIEGIKAEETMMKARREQEEKEEIDEMRRLPVSEGGLIPEAKPIILEDQYPCMNKVEEKILTEPVFSPSELRTSLRAVR